MKNKYFIIIFLPIILIVAGISGIFIFKALNTTVEDAVPASADEEYVYVLPINERESDEKTDLTKDPFSSGGSSSIILDGIMYNPVGTSLVIVSTSAKTFVVTTDDEIGDTGWVVAAINSNEITIERNGRIETLALTTDSAEGGFYN